MLQQLQALPGHLPSTGETCAESGGQEQEVVLGSLRGGRRELFLPLTNFTSELPKLMHHPPLTTLLREYLHDSRHAEGASSLELELDNVVLVDADPAPASFDQHFHRDVPLVEADDTPR